MTSHNQQSVQVVHTLPKIKDDGLTILFDNTTPEGSNLDVVFIHGLNGNPKSTWTHPKTKYYWPWELRDTLHKTRVMTFGYGAGITSELAQNFIRIKGVAAALNNALANKRITDEELRRPVVFICHSLGGLVAKAAAVAASASQANQANDIDQLYRAISGFIFFGVPHGGSKALNKTRVKVLQKMAKVAFTEIPPKVEQALQDSSDEVLDLTDNFRKISLYVDGRLIMASYYEGKGIGLLGDRVVDEFSAAIAYPRANDPEPINDDHIGMVKFEDEDDGNFEKVLGLLRRWETRLTQPVHREFRIIIDYFLEASLFIGHSIAPSTIDNLFRPITTLNVLEFATLCSKLEFVQTYGRGNDQWKPQALPVIRSLKASVEEIITHETGLEVEEPRTPEELRRYSEECLPKLRLDTTHTRALSEDSEPLREVQTTHRGRLSIGSGDMSPSTLSVSSVGSDYPSHSHSPLQIPRIDQSSQALPLALGIGARKSILCLDSGGVKALSQLLILDEVMKRLSKELGRDSLRPCEVFDLICGSSIGGALAIFLGQFKLDIPSSIKMFHSLAKKLFSRSHWDLPDMIKVGAGKSRYSNAQLKKVITELVVGLSGGSDSQLFETKGDGCKTFVTALVADSTLILRNYTLDKNLKDPLQPSLMISEALRVCFASPTYFDPIKVSGCTYFDGGVGCPNPSLLALREAKALWNVDPDDIGTFISMASGERPIADPIQSNSLFKLMGAMASVLSNPQAVHDQVTEAFADTTNETAYYRFNTGNLGDIDFDDAGSVDRVAAGTKTFLQSETAKRKIQVCVEALSNVYISGLLSQLDTIEGELDDSQGEDNTGGITLEQFKNRFPTTDPVLLERSLSARLEKLGKQLHRNWTERSKIENERARINLFTAHLRSKVKGP